MIINWTKKTGKSHQSCSYWQQSSRTDNIFWKHLHTFFHSILLMTTITCNRGIVKKKNKNLSYNQDWKMLPFSMKPETKSPYSFIPRRNKARHAWRNNKAKNKPILHQDTLVEPACIKQKTDDRKLNLQSWKAEISTTFKTTSSLKDSVSMRISSQPFDLTLASVGHLQNDDESKSKLNKVRTKWMPHYGSVLLHQFCKRWGHLSVQNPSSLMFPHVWLPPATSRLQAKGAIWREQNMSKGVFWEGENRPSKLWHSYSKKKL